RLELYGENSPLPLSQDDDSGGNLNPLINGFELQSDGTYQITLRGYSPTAAGAFRLTLQEGEFATPAVGNTIAFGQTIVEPLTGNQEAVYSFKATEGDVISVQVQAGFDTYLQILASDDRLMISDDDSGGELNPLIEFFEIPNTGEYQIVLRGYSASSVGTFQLTLSKSFSANTTPIAYGDTLTGLITDGRTAQFIFSGEVNDRITIFVESEFDSALELRDTAGNILIRDDDSGGNLQPLIENFVLPDTSDYVILVTGFSVEDEGNFTIVLQKN
ncbi:MAG TPA: hypothetical protein VJZ27_19080, partial [Aggregatilineales bacterium]|nr:hypothetical protein [Aggregatilineales bacterium]